MKTTSFVDEIPLSGVWQLKLGEYSDTDNMLPDTCLLPGTLDQNKKGSVNNEVSEYRLDRKYI